MFPKPPGITARQTCPQCFLRPYRSVLLMSMINDYITDWSTNALI